MIQRLLANAVLSRFGKKICNDFKDLYQFCFNPNYALGFRHESLKCKENGSSTVLLKRRRGHHHGEHQKEVDVPIIEAFSARNRYLNAYFGLNQVQGRKRKDSHSYHEYF